MRFRRHSDCEEFDHVLPVDDSDSVTATRTMIYRKRGLHIAFVRRAMGTDTATRLEIGGFTEPDGESVLSGEEALRRLKKVPLGAH